MLSISWQNVLKDEAADFQIVLNKTPAILTRHQALSTIIQMHQPDPPGPSIKHGSYACIGAEPTECWQHRGGTNQECQGICSACDQDLNKPRYQRPNHPRYPVLWRCFPTWKKSPSIFEKLPFREKMFSVKNTKQFHKNNLQKLCQNSKKHSFPTKFHVRSVKTHPVHWDSQTEMPPVRAVLAIRSGTFTSPPCSKQKNTQRGDGKFQQTSSWIDIPKNGDIVT